MTRTAIPTAFIASSSEVGGAELYLESLLEALGADWVAAVILPEEGEFAHRLRRAGHRVEVVRFGRRLGLLAAAARLRRTLDTVSCRLIHANGSRAALVSALARDHHRPLLWLRVDRTLDGRLGTLVARRCARTVGVSHSALEGLSPGARRRAEVIYPGVPDLNVDRTAGRALVHGLLGCAASDEVIVLSGRLGPSKGQSQLLDAAPAILKQRPNVRIAFLGGPRAAYPDYERELREGARVRGVSERVHFLGQRPSGIATADDAIRFVSGCDLLVAPSVREPPYGWQEGFGLAVAEAMHVGTPVVAYRNGSLPEVLGECGTLVPEADTSALATAIVAVLGDPACRERMVACARSRALERFRRADAIPAMRRAYTLAVSQREAPRRFRGPPQ